MKYVAMAIGIPVVLLAVLWGYIEYVHWLIQFRFSIYIVGCFAPIFIGLGVGGAIVAANDARGEKR